MYGHSVMLQVAKKKKNCAKICLTQTLTLDVVGLRFVAETLPVNLVSTDKHCFD